MIDFNQLKLVVNENYSFVGIKKQDDKLFFCLPKGFDSSISNLNTFLAKRDLFLLFYKILDVFKSICIEKGYLEESNRVSTQDRDGVINQAKGSEIQRENEEVTNFLYSKLDMFGHLINAYDEPKILSLAYRLGKSDRFDASKIHRYLHQAVYLQNNAAYVDEILLPRNSAQFEATDIVAMYCYLYYEIKQQLQEEVSAEVSALAERFRQRYLRVDDSIFDEQTYEQVLDTLKDTLEKIDNYTTLKDADYWQYYEVIELFIYGDWHQAEEGEIWGIKNFHSVWESMCLTYLVDTTDSCRLLAVDDTYLPSKTLRKLEGFLKPLDLSNTFQLNFSNLSPDAVMITAIPDLWKSSRNYLIYPDSWNDYGYCTFFKSKDGIHTRIAYARQKEGVHTIDSLVEHYSNSNKGLLIDSRLPSKYYSYWSIEDLDCDILHRMYYLNHFFYLAFEREIKNWKDFKEYILKPLNIGFGSRNNAFSVSLFRVGEAKAKLSFAAFIETASRLLPQDIEIIDIKYLPQSYFRDKNKIEEIKKRSIRKQFAYEYLLQKELEQGKEYYKNLNINSSFWTPDNRLDDPSIMKVSATFMDGFIELRNINFQALANNYLS